MAAAFVGNLSEFDETKESFSNYIERLDQIFEANEITETKKTVVFLSLLGPKVYKILRDIMQPLLPKLSKYDELVNALQNHFAPKTIIIAERFRFHRRSQEVGETIAEYMVGLKRLAATCEFGDFLDDAIRDRFVCGLKCEATQRRLLSKRDLKLLDAYEISLAMELADKNTSDMKTHVANINEIRKPNKSRNQKAGDMTFRDFRQGNDKKKCYRCGGPHMANTCRFATATCFKCSKTGHIAAVCKSNPKQINAMDMSEQKVMTSEEDTDENLYLVHTVNKVRAKEKEYTVHLKINGHYINMILDTAADVTTIAHSWIKKNMPCIKLQAPKVKLVAYNELPVTVMGQIDVRVAYNGQTHTLPLIVVEGDRPSLFGKNWIRQFKINFAEIFTIHDENQSKSVHKLIKEYDHIFKPSKEAIKGYTAKVKLIEGHTPMYYKARPVPYALKLEIEKEVNKTREEGIWDFVERSNWATPIVVVPKKNGGVRLCGDFKSTINPFIDANKYPLPTQQDLFATMCGGIYFSKLDMTHAYQQVELDKASQELLTLNTHMGLVRPKRLLYGISTAAAIFQAIMDKITSGLKSVMCYQDDILVMGRTETEHAQNLEKLLIRLNEHNIKLNLSKCLFSQDKIVYLGHTIDKTGVHPTEDKIEAIKAVPSPRNITELRSFLGILNYYNKFLKNSSSFLHPLHRLLRKDTSWEWSRECESVFQKCKELLTSKSLLVHYDPNKVIKLACDASPFGLGAVLSHVMENDEERPIAFASKTLTKPEMGYSQLEREALAIIFAVKKFQQYLFGKKFVLVTDHKPLVTIFGPKTAIPVLAAARIQRWALLLSSYQYTIEYKKGSEHQNADALSRAPAEGEFCIESNIYKLSYIEDLPITGKEIRNATRKDSTLSRICNYIKNGWPTNVEKALVPFLMRKDEMSIEDDCIILGMRVVIPAKYRTSILDLLHDTHSGITKMKAIARSHVWWPGIDLQIEQMAKSCEACQQNAPMAPTTPLQSWSWPRKPWERIHIDFAQKDKDNFLIIVDSHSKWLEVVRMASITTSHTIKQLRNIFARYGIPGELVSDNGTQLTSEEFEHFLKMNGVIHTLVPTYHPASNGSAERAVQTFKHALEKMQSDDKDSTSVDHKISRFLMRYRTTPHATTEISPSQLFLGREIRTRLSMIHPEISQRVHEHQRKQKLNYDKHHMATRKFAIGQNIRYRPSRLQKKWLLGKITNVMGNTTYVIEVEGKEKLVHVDQLRPNDAENVKPTTYEQEEEKNAEDATMDTCKYSEKLDEATDMFEPDDANAETNVNTGINDDLTLDSDTNLNENDDKRTDQKNPQYQHVNVRRNPVRTRSKPQKLNL